MGFVQEVDLLAGGELRPGHFEALDKKHRWKLKKGKEKNLGKNF